MEECVRKIIDVKNDRIDEETSEGENSDYVIPTVNDAEGTDLTISVDIEEGVVKNKKNKNDRIDEKKMTVKEQILVAPQ